MDINDMILVSIDDHLIEPADMFDKHTPERFKGRMPKLVRTEDGLDQWQWEGMAVGTTGLSAVGAVLLTVGLLLVATLGFLCVGMVWCGWGVGDAFGGEASGRGEGACAQCARAPAVCLQRPPLWLLEGGAQRARCGCGCGCPRRRRPAAATTRKGRRKRARKGRRPGCTHARTRRGDAYPLRRDACRIEPPTLRATSCVGARPAPSRPNARAYDHVRPHIRSVYLWNRIRGLRLDPSAYSSLRGAWRGGEGRG